MIKLKDILKEKTEGIPNPIVQKTDFNKPTVIHITADELELLNQEKRLEKDGITIIFGDEN